MPESRDRLVRQNVQLNLTPFRWGSTPLTGSVPGQHNGGGVAHLTRGRGLFGSPPVARPTHRQNTPPSGSFSRRGRGANSWAHGVLPSWYPRRPLADITHVHKALLKRERLGNDGQEQEPFLATPAFANKGELEFLTPQKRLLDSIDIVEKVVMDRLDRLKRTPAAKKAEREKRVRTLMSLR